MRLQCDCNATAILHRAQLILARLDWPRAAVRPRAAWQAAGRRTAARRAAARLPLDRSTSLPLLPPPPESRRRRPRCGATSLTLSRARDRPACRGTGERRQARRRSSSRRSGRRGAAAPSVRAGSLPQRARVAHGHAMSAGGRVHTRRVMTEAWCKVESHVSQTEDNAALSPNCSRSSRCAVATKRSSLKDDSV